MKTIDLAAIDAPDVVEALDFESVYQQLVAHFKAIYPHWRAALESDPVVKLLELFAYRELRLRARINDAGRSVMLAYATGADLEHLAALLNVARHTIVEADEPTEAVRESDPDLRARTQLAPQGFSVAGPEGAYISHARNAHAQVRDASAISPAPCEVLVTVLARDGDGTADPALIEAVSAALRADDVRPLTDQVTVQGAEILRYAVRARLVFFAGPDRAVALAAANKAMQQYTNAMHRLGMEVTLDGLYAAARAAGVQKVILESPTTGIAASRQQAPYCTSIELIDGGVYTHDKGAHDKGPHD
ncbi:baseplate assembly protein [Burkholderia sp. Nafp2/4-1b]|uniref:baseplate assembly protein n=1 Tax=Burkholderia sp. Nafp2/4-1b TaxID=2116686 RepID=UPI000EF8E572|nr:baseplate J/gp47 family protein [Burkholderia sp. Nafp2/4-1b]RKT98732.1 baseplate assembly protein [Burkholderia sp. Nafp2/4-1b]